MSNFTNISHFDAAVAACKRNLADWEVKRGEFISDVVRTVTSGVRWGKPNFPFERYLRFEDCDGNREPVGADVLSGDMKDLWFCVLVSMHRATVLGLFDGLPEERWASIFNKLEGVNVEDLLQIAFRKANIVLNNRYIMAFQGDFDIEVSAAFIELTPEARERFPSKDLKAVFGLKVEEPQK